MKIAICNETYRDWSFEDAFRHASETGYDGIEIAPFTINPDAWQITDERCRQIAALARDNNLEIVGLHWLLAFTEGLHLTSRDEGTRSSTSDYLGQLAQVCRQLGGDVMVFGSPSQRNMAPGMNREEADELAADCIRQTIPHLEEHNIVLALEPLGPEEGNYLLTSEWGRELVDRCNSPNVRLHLDVKAMSTESQSIPDIIAASKNVLAHFHCNDPNRRGPGMGDVPYEPIITALNDANYCGWLSVEVFDESVPPETTAEESIRYLRKLL
ncbi:MAG: sugar phosphate isomerase/epimerase family protein [Pirellulaceae bacterium]